MRRKGPRPRPEALNRVTKIAAPMRRDEKVRVENLADELGDTVADVIRLVQFLTADELRGLKERRKVAERMGVDATRKGKRTRNAA